MSRSKLHVILVSVIGGAILVAVNGCEKSRSVELKMIESSVPGSVQAVASKPNPEPGQNAGSLGQRPLVEPDPEIPVDWDSYKVLQEMRESWLPPPARDQHKTSPATSPNG